MNLDSPIKVLGDEADDYVDSAHQSLAHIQPTMAYYPLGYGKWLQALAYALSKPREIVTIGKLEAADTAALLGIAQDGYQPYQIVAVGAPDSEMILPAFQDRAQIGDRATAYVCDAPVPGSVFACQAPVTNPGVLQSLLQTG